MEYMIAQDKAKIILSIVGKYYKMNFIMQQINCCWRTLFRWRHGTCEMQIGKYQRLLRMAHALNLEEVENIIELYDLHRL